MSNYHITDLSPKEDKVKVIFHIPIPDENNSAGVNLRTALAQYISNAGITASAVPWDVSSEETQILNGMLYEHSETVYVDANLTLVQKRNIIDARYTVLTTQAVSKIQSILKYWGLNRDVP